MKPNYDLELLKLIDNLDYTPKILLHSCCGPCSSYVISNLSNYFDITVVYYNPNIEPVEEYNLRKSEQIKLLKSIKTKNKLDFIDSDYDNNLYHEFNCSNDIVASDVTAIKICNSLVTRFGVEKMYITDYKVGNRDDPDDKNNFKGLVETNNSNVFSSGLQDYVAYLPTYSKVPSLNGACYRLVVEFKKLVDDTSECAEVDPAGSCTKDADGNIIYKKNDFYTYATIEILKGSRC